MASVASAAVLLQKFRLANFQYFRVRTLIQEALAQPEVLVSDAVSVQVPAAWDGLP